MNNITINLEVLRTISNRLFERLINEVGNKIEFSNDYYWDISDEEIFNLYETPVDLTLGQISDEILEINRQQFIVHDFKRLAIILKAISIEYPTVF